MSRRPEFETKIIRSLAIFATALVLAMIPLHISAAEIEDVPFSEQVEVVDQTLPLFGLGLLRYRVVFRGYVGGLYLPRDVEAKQVLSDVPKALELYYFWDIEGRFFGESAITLLERTHGPERVARMRPQLDRLHALYRDVEAGDRYRLSYVPGRGTTLAYNGEELGTVPGADFARDYFGIWLGEDPINDSFRDQILSGR